MKPDEVTYEKLMEHNPKIKSVLSRKRFEFVQNQNKRTITSLEKLWKKQARRNMAKLFKKHGLVNENCIRMGMNKAVIAIGAGPGFNRNKDYLKKLCYYNSKFQFEQQPFIFICSNHQYKPCLELGILPHFVIWADASNVVYDQLCRDISPRGQHVTLIASLHCNPRVLEEWDRQGRLIQFYLPLGDNVKKLYKDKTGKDAAKYQVAQGGNVMNVAFCIAAGVFDSRIFITVGNDLSYDFHEDTQKRRESYYADKNYSTNLATGRDEAGRQFKWIGFDLKRNMFTDDPQLKFKPVATVQSLFNYKTWIESHCMINDPVDMGWHYYNCSEQGILGVVAKDERKEKLDDVNNWMLMDEILPRRWHTRLLEDAVKQYLSVRELWIQKLKRVHAGIVSGMDATLLHNDLGISAYTAPEKRMMGQ
jgi:hypothetical protein